MSRKIEILDLRKRGYGIKTIASQLSCPLSTVAYHCRGTPKAIKNNTRELAKKASVANQKKWQTIRDEAEKLAIEMWYDLKSDPEFMAFMGIYWGEGYKTQRSTVGVRNNDYLLIVVCYNFFLRIWPKCRIKAYVGCYPSHDINKCKVEWQRLLPSATVLISKIKSSSGDEFCDRCVYGTCSLKVHNVRIATVVLTWLKIWRDSVNIG